MHTVTCCSEDIPLSASESTCALKRWSRFSFTVILGRRVMTWWVWNFWLFRQEIFSTMISQRYCACMHLHGLAACNDDLAGGVFDCVVWRKNISQEPRKLFGTYREAAAWASDTLTSTCNVSFCQCMWCPACISWWWPSLPVASPSSSWIVDETWMWAILLPSSMLSISHDGLYTSESKALDQIYSLCCGVLLLVPDQHHNLPDNIKATPQKSMAA